MYDPDQKILGCIRRAVADYNMINDGDKIAVGLSGGKDSISLLISLKWLQKFYKKRFNLIAISVNPGMDEFDNSVCKKVCEEMQIEYIEYQSQIKEIVFDIRKESNPCSLCANLRRGILNSVAIENKCNKIALGHHLDDVLETFFLSLFYEGRIHTFSPVTYLDRTDLTIIRPMIYVEERDIRGYVKNQNIKVMGKCCPHDGYSNREFIKELIKSLLKHIPRLKDNIFGVITRNIDSWQKHET